MSLASCRLLYPANRNDAIRTRNLSDPNRELYQIEPHSAIFYFLFFILCIYYIIKFLKNQIIFSILYISLKTYTRNNHFDFYKHSNYLYPTNNILAAEVLVFFFLPIAPILFLIPLRQFIIFNLV